MSSGSTRARIEDLTDTPRRVLDLIAEGTTNHEIGQALGITLDGAKYHVTEILNKLGVDSREEAAALVGAERQGIRSAFSRIATRRVIAAAAAVGAVAVALAITLLAFSGNEEDAAVPAVQIAFLTGEFDPEGGDMTKQIVVVDGDANTRTFGEPAPYAVVDWAPDGRNLMAVRATRGEIFVSVFDVSSSEHHDWPSPGLLQATSWSPDSSLIALQTVDLDQFPATLTATVLRPDGSSVAAIELADSREEGGGRSLPRLIWSPDSRWVVADHRGRDIVLLGTSGASRELPLPDDFGEGDILPIDWTADGLRIMNGSRLRADVRAAWLLRDLDGDWVATDAPDLEAELAAAQSVEAEFAPAYSLADSIPTSDGRGHAYAFTEPRTTPMNRPPRVAFIIVRAHGVDARIEAPPDVYEFPDVQISVVLAP